MAIQLDHLIVPSHNPVESAQSLANLLDVPWEPQVGHFTPVYVNDTPVSYTHLTLPTKA